MPFEKGRSGNPRGRKKMTAEQKKERDKFQSLLRSSTVTALTSIIQIANDRYSKDRFKACAFLIEKAYGANTTFLLDGTEEQVPVVIKVQPYKNNSDEEEWEREWNEADNEDLEED